jgi:twitching motility protein PilT
MIANDGVKNCIAQGQVHQIYNMIQIGAQEGMVLMDQSLETLCQTGIINKEEALSKASDIEALAAQLATV